MTKTYISQSISKIYEMIMAQYGLYEGCFKAFIQLGAWTKCGGMANDLINQLFCKIYKIILAQHGLYGSWPITILRPGAWTQLMTAMNCHSLRFNINLIVI